MERSPTPACSPTGNSTTRSAARQRQGVGLDVGFRFCGFYNQLEDNNIPEACRSPKGHGTNCAQRRVDLFGCIHQARCEAGVGNPVRCSARHDLVLEQSFDHRFRLHSVHIKADEAGR